MKSLLNSCSCSLPSIRDTVRGRDLREGMKCRMPSDFFFTLRSLHSHSILSILSRIFLKKRANQALSLVWVVISVIAMASEWTDMLVQRAEVSTRCPPILRSFRILGVPHLPSLFSRTPRPPSPFGLDWIGWIDSDGGSTLVKVQVLSG